MTIKDFKHKNLSLYYIIAYDDCFMTFLEMRF